MAGLGRCAAAAYKTEQKPTSIYGGARNGEPEGNGRGTGSAQGGSMIWRKSLRRCVGRSNNNANANGGLVYANTNNGSSNSNTNNGVRLAIRPKGVVIDTLLALQTIVSTECRHVLAGICGRRDRATATAMGNHREAETSKGGSLMKGE